jgi:hypothetical protein
MATKQEPVFSGAVSLKREKDQRYGTTIGTMKLYRAKYNGDLSPEQQAKLPKFNGFIIIDAQLAQDAIVEGKGKDKKNKILVNVAVWGSN